MNLDNQRVHKKVISIGTLTVLMINVTIFILLKFLPGIGENIFLNPEINSILAKPWTVITVFFAHENIVHIIANMVVLLIFGRVLEEITSAKTVIIVYLISGLIGSLTVPLIAQVIQWTGPVMGASAATFGIVSTFAVMRPNYKFYEGKSKIYNMLFGGTAKLFAILLFVINLIIFIMDPSTSIGAASHTAGIIVGAIYGCWLKVKYDQQIDSYNEG